MKGDKKQNEIEEKKAVMDLWKSKLNKAVSVNGTNGASYSNIDRKIIQCAIYDSVEVILKRLQTLFYDLAFISQKLKNC